jgi:hypothetical protein
MRFKLNLRYFFAVLLSLLTIACCTAMGADVVSMPAQMTLPGFVSAHWAEIGFLLSEACAFLPTKFAGIAKTVISFFGMIITKKK